MLSYLLSLWQRIPLSLRKCFYSLPLFVQWWPFLYFEKDKRTIETLHSALAYFLFFMLASLLSSILYLSADFFSDLTEYILYYLVFAWQSLWGFLYIGLSLALAYESYTAKRLGFWNLRVRFAQNFVKGIEKLFHSV